MSNGCTHKIPNKDTIWIFARNSYTHLRISVETERVCALSNLCDNRNNSTKSHWQIELNSNNFLEKIKWYKQQELLYRQQYNNNFICVYVIIMESYSLDFAHIFILHFALNVKKANSMTVNIETLSFVVNIHSSSYFFFRVEIYIAEYHFVLFVCLETCFCCVAINKNPNAVL